MTGPRLGKKSSAGTGSKILKNIQEFKSEINHQKTKVNSGFYYLDISFNNEHGFMSFEIENGIVKKVDMNCEFERQLGSYNDPSLITLAKHVALSLKIL